MSDVCLAVPGKVVGLQQQGEVPMGEVDFGGVRKEVCMQYVPEIGIGDYVVVHVGFAIQRLDEESALATLAEFERMGLLEEEFADPFRSRTDGREQEGTR